MNKQKYTLIDTAGQLTAVFDKKVSLADQPKIGKQLLDQYQAMGQVAFISFTTPLPTIQMMGGELSVNGSIAAAFYLINNQNQADTELLVSGINEPVSARRTKEGMVIVFPATLIRKVMKNEVIYQGIKYRLVRSINEVSCEQAQIYCGDDPAAGLILEPTFGRIIPFVYVKATSTFVKETACGSASLAYSVLTGCQNVTQPSGSVITITRSSGKLSISTQCKEIGYASISVA